MSCAANNPRQEQRGTGSTASSLTSKPTVPSDDGNKEEYRDPEIIHEGHQWLGFWIHFFLSPGARLSVMPASLVLTFAAICCLPSVTASPLLHDESSKDASEKPSVNTLGTCDNNIPLETANYYTVDLSRQGFNDNKFTAFVKFFGIPAGSLVQGKFSFFGSEGSVLQVKTGLMRMCTTGTSYGSEALFATRLNNVILAAKVVDFQFTLLDNAGGVLVECYYTSPIGVCNAPGGPPDVPRKYICDFDNENTDEGISGNVELIQYGSNGALLVSGNVTGLTDGFHGFHIHEVTELPEMGCADTGGHFNPFEVFHGGPTKMFSKQVLSIEAAEAIATSLGRDGLDDTISGTRHTGDLGNIYSESNTSMIHVLERPPRWINLFEGARFGGPTLYNDTSDRADVRGRVMVIHADPDQFTQSGDDERQISQELIEEDLAHTGRAGGRIACCVIEEY
eukprot:CAMPEP_0170176164 /NCGR_PEP_ID=MMETSP0040_2-20121228/9106_1 /TAXON_ID=641309 /ORGANISM="Lotharella oceanica, Strain CCMP622" /LENGTH=450 /DNA_ID=CAMNT_0010418401 /DNA_START=252 /DNA_END=1605 /DNA_ORIENTATION=-